MNQPHTFIGIPISNRDKIEYETIQKGFHLPKYYKKIVNKEDFHVTLLFLGSWEPEKRVQLWKELESTLSKVQAFPITFSHLNIFGNQKTPRVFYISMEKQDKLIQLQSSIQKEAELLGFPKSQRDYNPHMTLAKKWRNLAENKPESWIFPSSITKREQLVDRICLYQIHPSQEPMYEKISTIHLL
ncbi:RNA 2',3'-cyclic phosphodiesterase [Salipaludibacillus daqingensis]|uniref:RNA 2',3'-cyclic phosphodiesterase n=1 Tax=Salipaludibacillus daqingensis TaxID=3041001 RepID=UPI002476A457|nr:RNA 2',3'-cyclic phosphodiesterase [Salipaludibacillus daqingensis]